MTAFAYPKEDVTQWTRVVWYDNPDGERGIAAYVTQPKTDSADLSVLGPTGPKARHDCWHIDDPRVKEMGAQIFRPDRGVFRIAPQEAETKELLARVRALESRFNTLKLADALGDEPAARGKR